jgi:hypothetical protein
VYADTLQYVPDILAWGQEHIDIVHVIVFIAIRAAVLESKFDYYAGADKVDMSPIVYSTPEETQRLDILSNDVVEAIRTRYPDFEPSAYLNGTEKADSFKWLLTGRIGTKKAIHGYVGPKFMELAQTLNHLRKGTYLAYTNPSVQRKAKAMLLLAPLDRGLRGVARKFLRSLAKNPLNLFRRLHLQSVTIIQPADILCDGSMSMCDGCPDITVWKDELVWSCRLEEQIKFGCFVRAVPKGEIRTGPCAHWWLFPSGSLEHRVPMRFHGGVIRVAGGAVLPPYFSSGSPQIPASESGAPAGRTGHSQTVSARIPSSE